MLLVFGVLKVTSLTYLVFRKLAVDHGNIHLSFQYSVFDGLRVSDQPFATLPGCLFTFVVFYYDLEDLQKRI